MEVMFGALEITASWIWVHGSSVFCFVFFLFSVKAVLYSHLVFPLEESSVFVPLRDTCALPDSYTVSVAVSKPRGVCSLVG